MADDRDKLEGQRATIREHIEKYEKYQHSDPDAMNMALRTIRSAQEQIRTLVGRHSHWPPSWEDDWRP